MTTTETGDPCTLQIMVSPTLVWYAHRMEVSHYPSVIATRYFIYRLFGCIWCIANPPTLKGNVDYF